MYCCNLRYITSIWNLVFQIHILNEQSGCQVGGHVKKGGKEDIFTWKEGQKEDIFYQKLIQINQKCI